MTALAFVDIETSGLSPTADAITEVAVIRVDDSPGGVVEWSTLVNPGRPIPARIKILTGVSDAAVRRTHLEGCQVGEDDHLQSLGWLVRDGPAWAAVVGGLPS